MNMVTESAHNGKMRTDEIFNEVHVVPQNRGQNTDNEY